MLRPRILFWEDTCNFTGKIIPSSSKVCLEVFSISVHIGFNLIIRANDVVKQGSHFLFLELGLLEFFKGVVGLL